jgi:asparagine synthase (glutamine-hydrolysing)
MILMCGIAGLMTSDHTVQAQEATKKMISALAHRGPDANGYAKIPLQHKNVFLGHTRLAIVDLSDKSNQPMKDSMTGSWLVFNGEIYNFRELRRQLEILDISFETDGDTEVLLQALLQWGDHALEKLHGMFAFAFWNGTRQEWLLARDPLGIKPLYYSLGQDYFAFASEVAALVRSGICSSAIDSAAVSSFLTYGAVQGPNTIYKDVQELEPGHKLRISREYVAHDNAYWSLGRCLREIPQSSAVDFQTAAWQIEQSLDRAVASHLIGDVPVGIFLSGGVDSSLLALSAARCSTEPVTLLTLSFREPQFSEVAFARQVADQLPFRHEVIPLEANQLRQQIPAALSAMDQPTVDGINTFVICRAGIGLGLKVLLTGIGGDELFGGYTTFSKIPVLKNYGRLLRPLAHVLSRVGTRNPIQWKKLAQVSLPLDTTDAYLLQRSIRWKSSFAADSSLLVDQVDFLSNEFQKVSALELLCYTRNQLLRDADVFSMANSVELRVPFLDLSLVRAALALGPEYHFEGNVGKRLTRHILNARLEKRLPQRRKQGFTFPWQSWLRSELKPMIVETIRDKSIYDSLAIDPGYGEALLRGFERGDPYTSWSEVWSLFVLLSWLARNEVHCAAA